MQGSTENKQRERDVPENKPGSEKLAPGAGKTLPGSSIGRAAWLGVMALVLIAGISVGAVALIRNTNFVGISTTSQSTASQSQSSAGNSALATNANGVVNFIDAPG